MLTAILHALYTRNDTLILMPAGAAKTTWGNQIFLSWLIALFKDVRVGLFSQTSDFAGAFSLAIMRTYEENEEHRKLFGDLTNGGKWTATGWHRKGSIWAQSKDYTLFAGGTGGQVASKRFDVLVGDDMLGEDNTKTPDQREKTKAWFDQSLEPRVLSSGVRIIFGTRWAEGDLYQTLATPVDEGGYGYDTHIIRALIEDPGPDEIRLDDRGDVAFRRLDGFRSYWEKVWPVEFLLGKRAKNPAMFDCVYQQDIGGLLSGDIFQRQWIQYYGTVGGDPSEELPPGTYSKRMGVDLASSVKERADYTARVTTAQDSEGNFFVMRVVRDKIDVGHAQFIVAGYEEFPGIGMVFVEKNQFQSVVVAEIMRDYAQLPVKGHNADDDKRQRGQAVGAKYQARKVWHHRSLRDSDFERELLSFDGRKRTHDDMVDALGYSMDLGGDQFFFGRFDPMSREAKMAQMRRMASGGRYGL